MTARILTGDCRTIVPSLIKGAIEAAYIEGYVNGQAHPKGQPIIPKAKELAHLFWRVVEEKVEEALTDIHNQAILEERGGP